MTRSGGMKHTILPSEFYARPAETVARELIGTRIVSTVGGLEAIGRIVETEAYVGPHDDASHAAARTGRTTRNAAMFGLPGTAYVYRIYGVHWCLNVVTDREDYGAAVLVRAVEVIAGQEIMRQRRGRNVPDRALCSGPGNLARSLGVTGDLDGHSLALEPLSIRAGESVPDSAVGVSPRIGITRAADWPLRFFEKSNSAVSGRRPRNRRIEV